MEGEINSVSLKEYFETRIRGLECTLSERDRRMEERYNGQQSALRMALENLAEYKTNSNEWRATLGDQKAENLTRTEYQSKHDVLVEKIDTVSGQVVRIVARTDELERISKSRFSTLTVWFIGLGVVISLVVGIAQVLGKIK